MADKNGYNPSIIQNDTSCCYLCGRTTGKLDRHEVYPGSNRQKSKALGLWVVLCHEPCHMQKAHGDKSIRNYLQERGQLAAMGRYGWSIEEFRRVIGRSYI